MPATAPQADREGLIDRQLFPQLTVILCTTRSNQPVLLRANGANHRVSTKVLGQVWTQELETIT